MDTPVAEDVEPVDIYEQDTIIDDEVRIILSKLSELI
jgi:hypothetical protein